MSSLWTNLLFMHGYIADVELARRLANPPAPSSPPSGKRQRIAKTGVSKRKTDVTPAVLGQGGCVST
jgi:hypothetical protein